MNCQKTPVLGLEKNGFQIEKTALGSKKTGLGSVKNWFWDRERLVLDRQKKTPVLRSDNWSTEYLTSLRLGEVFIC